MNPEISVILPVYNGAKYLKEAINSIINQSFAGFELIIINDGSTDNSLNIIKSYKDDRIKLIDQQNTGLSAALNNGIRFAQCECIARMDQDDISHPERLEKQLEFMKNHSQCVALGCNAEIIDQDGNYIYTSNQYLNWNEIKNHLPTTPFFHSSVMFLKTAYSQANGYPQIRTDEDTVFFNRLSRFGEFNNLPETLIKYRLSPGAMSPLSSSFAKKLSKVVLRIIIRDDLTDNNGVTHEDIKEIDYIFSQTSYSVKKQQYHLRLAKKYLWNNHQPKLARKNLTESIRARFSISSCFYYFVSFLPSVLILKLYKNLIRNN